LEGRKERGVESLFFACAHFIVFFAHFWATKTGQNCREGGGKGGGWEGRKGKKGREREVASHRISSHCLVQRGQPQAVGKRKRREEKQFGEEKQEEKGTKGDIVAGDRISNERRWFALTLLNGRKGGEGGGERRGKEKKKIIQSKERRSDT